MIGVVLASAAGAWAYVFVAAAFDARGVFVICLAIASVLSLLATLGVTRELVLRKRAAPQPPVATVRR